MFYLLKLIGFFINQLIFFSLLHIFYYIYIVKIKSITYYFIVVFIIIPFLVSSQTEIDDLKYKLKSSTDSTRIYFLKQLSDLYKEDGNFQEAYKYFTEYSRLKDSVQNIKHSAELKRLQAQSFNTEQNKVIQELSQNNVEQDEIIKKLKFYKNTFLICTLLILLLLILFFYNLRRKIIANRKLSVQNEKIKGQNDQIKTHTIRLAKINRELEKLSIVASKTDNAIVITKPDGEIEWINEGFTRLYGYTLDEFINEKGRTIIQASANKDIHKIVKKIISEKKSQIYESEVRAKSGLVYNTQTTLTPILNEKNEITQLIAIDTDISELKRVEQELQKLLVTKDKFFSIIAHDLKNPFNSLMGVAQLLYHGYSRMSPEKVQHFHKSFYQISKNGYELLVNLLEWARSQMGTIKFNPGQQNLYAITEETFSLYNAKASQKEIVFNNSLNKDSFAFADKNMLKTIFRNIISNALKFTERGGAIEVSEVINESFTEITIKDTGVGINPEDLNKLFKLDENHSTNGTEDETGTGLGLILCKEFIEKHGGKIWVESKVGVGSKFIFTLPLKELAPNN